MRIPEGPNGFPTVSPTMVRRYGTGGFKLAQGEETRGCPRLWRKQYVEHVVEDEYSYPLAYGSLIHEVFERMETADLGPDDALAAVFPSYAGTLGPEAYEEAQNDLRAYMNRGASPRDRYGTMATETELTALLFEHETEGPIYVRGIIDWLGVDMDDPTTLHVVDYKTNRGRTDRKEVRGDVQMRFYDLLLALCWHDYMQTARPNIVVHLDEIKFDTGDIEIRYTPEERDVFRSWLIAVISRIISDDKGKPKLNPGCAYCPVKRDCPAYAKLPDMAQQVLELRPDGETTDDLVMSWRDSAWKMKTLLEKACKEVDAQFEKVAKQRGGLTLTDYVYEPTTKWENQIDLRALHAVLGDEFYEVVTASKTALEKLTRDWEPSEQAAVMATLTRVAIGSEIKKQKVEK